MRSFVARLFSYRKTLLTLLISSVAPYLFGLARDALVTWGFEWAWEKYKGPAVLTAWLQLAASHPISSLGLAVIVYLLIAGVLSERHIKRTQRPQVDSPAAKPTMALFDTINAIPQAGKEMQSAIAGMGMAMGRWNREATAMMARQPKSQGTSAANKYWTDQARCLIRLSSALEGYSGELRSATSKFRSAVDSRMYWHAKRGTAADIMEASAADTFELIKKQSQQSRLVFLSNKEKLEGLTGWHNALDKSADRHRQTIDRVISELQSVEKLLQDMLDFRRRRTGLRGIVARLRHWLMPSRT